MSLLDLFLLVGVAIYKLPWILQTKVIVHLKERYFKSSQWMTRFGEAVTEEDDMIDVSNSVALISFLGQSLVDSSK